MILIIIAIGNVLFGFFVGLITGVFLKIRKEKTDVIQLVWRGNRALSELSSVMHGLERTVKRKSNEKM
jgi:ABC-type phosphate transport system permease subunit